MLKAVLLAAGEGTRMKSKTHKVLHKIFDKTILGYEIDVLKSLNVSEIIAVVGSCSEQIQETFPDLIYAMQNERLGTGHAAMMAADHLDDEGDVIILYGDIPLITAECIKAIYDYHKEGGYHVTMTSAIVENPYGYGRVIRENGTFKKIVEQKDASPEEAIVKEINTGVYCYKAKELKYALSKLDNNNAQKEYYLTDTLEILLKAKYSAGVFVADSAEDFYGINTRVQLFEATKIMQKRINEKHMLNGVTIIDRDNTYIGPDVTIGEDTIIYPGVLIEGNTAIGKDCEIGVNSRIKDAVIGNECTIQSSIILNSQIGNHVSIGPFSHIRPDCVLGDNVKIGDFVEIKKSTIGDGTKAAHLTYIGDAEVGKNINFGCGTVVVNYDGKHKYKTIIKDNVFIGCNSNLLSPVTVNEGAYIAAGSTITDDVPNNALAIARARQVLKLDWKRKEK